MADKVAMTWCVFIAVVCVLLSTYALGAVPDGLVYTEMQKTFVRGSQGVLTCRFYGRPWAVYWSKGKFDPLNPYSSIVWNDGAISGPRYDDGSYDIDDEFSLILKNVSATDAGRVFCTVSNYEGHLIDNYTDVSVTNTALETNPHATLQMRVAPYGILQCTVHIKARRVSWTKITSSSANQSLVFVESCQDYIEVNGTGYNQGNYNITQDYSLVIEEVRVHHEGLYVCEVTDFDTGISFKDKTFVTVIAQPLAPFPTIQECVYTGKYGSTNEYCTLVAKSEMTLTCEANGYYPAFHLYFLYGSRQVEPLETNEFNNIDGTRNKTVTIASVGTKELYTCVASNIPGGSEDESTSVLLHVEHDGRPDKQNGVLTIMMIYARSSATKQVGYKPVSPETSGLVPVLQGHYIYKAELVEMAFQLVIQDLLPIAKPFDISFTKLVSYRQEFHPSHLGMGTINLLTKLLVEIKENTSSILSMQGDRRDIFCKKLGKLQYRNVATRGMCVYEMSYGELFRIADAMEQASEEGHTLITGGEFQSDKTTLASTNDQSDEVCCLVTPSASSHLGDAEENETMKMMETGLTGDSLEMPNKTIKPAILLSENLITLQRILQLKDEDMTSDVESSNTTFTLLKIWKEKPRQSVFNYRAALAYELRQNKMSRLADQVLEGKYIKEETSHEFIQNVVESLTRDQLKNLGNLLKFSKGNWHTETPLDDITKQICDWVADWTKKMKGDSKTFFKGLNKLKNDVIDVTRFTPESKEHRDLNDKLVDNGFLALAREVMIIEQQLAWM
ncbi:uncharacterized protein LOC121424166 [Lytechinus variegatus]|uniref:uncharacterized protein LOC121424166 n=1 Tax=Lytechinus variegatus TaxID=7654 RepID=UPI001BB1B71E|nr:uncharacterized protein LOC121424166 [Lytechinus variegatus]